MNHILCNIRIHNQYKKFVVLNMIIREVQNTKQFERDYITAEFNILHKALQSLN